MKELETGKPIYKHECIFIINPELEKTLLDTIMNRYRKLARSFQGHMKSEEWGEKRLAYPIKRDKSYNSGYYVQMFFDATIDQAEELARAFNTDDTILKHIIVKHDPDFEYEDDPITPEENEQSVCESKPRQVVDVFNLIFGMEE